MIDTRVSYPYKDEFMSNWMTNVCPPILTEYHIGGLPKTYHTRPLYEDIDRVIFHNPATIVFWKDGTKTVAKCYNENYDPEKGLMMAILKKFMTYSQLNKLRKKYDEGYLPEIKIEQDYLGCRTHLERAFAQLGKAIWWDSMTKGENHEKDDVD